jgi:hypothetical protein
MYRLKHGLIREGRKHADWGQFIEPDRELESLKDPNEKLNVFIPSGLKADFMPFLGHDPLFDSIAGKIIAQRDQMSYEEQCSGKYYFDCFRILQHQRDNINRIAEVGTYLGGSSCIFAGLVSHFDFELDLIEAHKDFLIYTYERIRRAFPEATQKIRLFYGDLPSYIKNVAAIEKQNQILFHHDASHNFNQVVNDIASISFVKDKSHGLMIQDTHLRASVNNYVFVDAAVLAIFGFNVKYLPLGIKHAQPTEPGYSGSTYFIDQHPEGFYIPFNQNHFHYPHRSMSLSEMDTVE